MGSHGCSRITPLTPVKWVGPTHYQAVMLHMSVQRDTSIKPHFTKNVKCFFRKTQKRYGLTQEGGVYIPRMNCGGFDTEIR